MELHFWERAVHPSLMSRNQRSLQILSEHFRGLATNLTGEKTPNYANVPLVPYWMRILLPGVKLVFTLRRAIELELSLYTWRKWALRNVPLRRYVYLRLKLHEEWLRCRNNTLQVPSLVGLADTHRAGVQPPTRA